MCGCSCLFGCFFRVLRVLLLLLVCVVGSFLFGENVHAQEMPTLVVFELSTLFGLVYVFCSLTPLSWIARANDVHVV